MQENFNQKVFALMKNTEKQLKTVIDERKKFNKLLKKFINHHQAS